MYFFTNNKWTESLARYDCVACTRIHVFFSVYSSHPPRTAKTPKCPFAQQCVEQSRNKSCGKPRQSVLSAAARVISRIEVETGTGSGSDRGSDELLMALACLHQLNQLHFANPLQTTSPRSYYPEKQMIRPITTRLTGLRKLITMEMAIWRLFFYQNTFFN